MEKILIGMNKQNKIVLVVYKKELFRINSENLVEEFNKIEQKHPGFKETFYKPGTTKIIKENQLEKYLQQKININKEILEQKINNSLKQFGIQIKNTKVHEQTINKCKDDIITGKQIKLNASNYSLGKTMFATQNVGKIKPNQEDSVLILNHPQNENFKLLAVSDGVGGAFGGELASNHIVKKLTNWFESLNPNMSQNIEEVQASLNNMLPHILDDLKDAPKEASATLSAVIIGQDQTLITNIGDSRVYSVKNGQLNQETRDDSFVQALLDTKIIPNKELMRFNQDSNMITNSVNRTNHDFYPNYKIISNASYDKIIATSDGVTDCMSEKELQNIINKSKPEKLTSNIVNYALNKDSHILKVIQNLPKEENRKIIKQIKENPDFVKNYTNIIESGKDNTTAAAFIKK